MLFERLYEDNVAGKIDDARFAKMSKRYEQEQGENAKKIKALRLELKKDESKRMDIDDFLETVRRYADATTILDISGKKYAFDSTTIPLCLATFPWAKFSGFLWCYKITA